MTIRSIVQIVDRFIEGLLIIAFLSILFLSLFSIGLRYFEIGMSWPDALSRRLVFIAAFLGGYVTTVRGEHISIDLLSRYLRDRSQGKLLKIIEIFVALVSAFSTFWLSIAAYELYQSERQYPVELFLGIQSHVMVLALTIGLAMIAARFILGLIGGLRGAS